MFGIYCQYTSHWGTVYLALCILSSINLRKCGRGCDCRAAAGQPCLGIFSVYVSPVSLSFLLYLPVLDKLHDVTISRGMATPRCFCGGMLSFLLRRITRYVMSVCGGVLLTITTENCLVRAAGLRQVAAPAGRPACLGSHVGIDRLVPVLCVPVYQRCCHVAPVTWSSPLFRRTFATRPRYALHSALRPSSGSRCLKCLLTSSRE